MTKPASPAHDPVGRSAPPVLAPLLENKRFRGYFWRFCEAYSVLLRRIPWQFRSRRAQSLDYLNVGCGLNCPLAFLNLDLIWWPGVDVCWNITRPLPMPENRFAGIFTEHCLEHLSYDEVALALAEFHRLLRPGASARIIVPDASLYIDAYIHGRSAESNQSDTAGRFPSGEPTNGNTEDGRTPMMAVQKIFQGWGHRSAYDFQTFETLLSAAGFTEIEQKSLGESSDPTLLLDTPERADESLYIEARKPWEPSR